MLKKKLTQEPEAAIASLYKKVSDKEWVLDLEEDAPANDDSEYRRNNIVLMKERDTLKKQLEELSAKAAPQEQQAKTLTEQVAHLRGLIEKEQQKSAAAEKKARIEGFRSSVLSTAQQKKVRDDKAAKALYVLASQTYREESDGSFKPYDDRDSLIYSKQKGKETEPMSLDEWMEGHKAGDYKDFFSQPQGGGGRGSSTVDTSGFLRISKKDAANPNPEQLKAMADKKAVYEDS